MEEHSWEPKPSLFDRSNLLDPSKFSDMYFCGNLFHRKREWQIPGQERALTFLPFVPLFPSHQTVQNPTMQKHDGLLLVNDTIMYKATPTPGCIFGVWWLPQTVILHSWNCLVFKHSQEAIGTQMCHFLRENMINFKQCSSLRSCLYFCLNICQIKNQTYFIKIQLASWDFEKCFIWLVISIRWQYLLVPC